MMGIDRAFFFSNFPLVEQFLGSSALGRAIAFFWAWLILWLPIAVPLARFLQWQPGQPLASNQKIGLLASLYLLAPAIAWGAIVIEGSSFAECGFVWEPQLFISLVLGLGFGVGGLAVVFAIESAAGWIQWQRQNLGKIGELVLPILALGLWIGGTEELVFRGFLLNELNRDYSLWIAALISSIIFALLHLVWEQKETLPQLPGLAIMGFVLVLARLADGGNLGLAWGLHAGWIWGLTCLESASTIAPTGKGPVWVTGWSEKPLAGAAGLLYLLAMAAILWWVG